MELFLREKLRPRCAPPLAERPEIFRSDLVAFGIDRRLDPRLGTSREHMRDRNKPRRIVKRSRANVDNFSAPARSP
jgi:hypothetical protein